MTEEYSYDIFGKVIGSLSALGNSYYFTGREYDPETGLYYYRERHYSPIIGRFLQVDPLRIDDENPYTYRYNDPVNWVDPYGLMSIPPTTGPIIVPPPVPKWEPPAPKPDDNELPNGGQGSKEPGAVGAGAGAGASPAQAGEGKGQGGKPGSEKLPKGFRPGKKFNPDKPVRIPWDPGKKGYPDKGGNYWEPSRGHSPGDQPHWDVQHPDGSHTRVPIQ